MNILDRYLKKPALEDLRRKMVFIGGPRQVGKTTLALDKEGIHCLSWHTFLNSLL